MMGILGHTVSASVEVGRHVSKNAVSASRNVRQSHSFAKLHYFVPVSVHAFSEAMSLEPS
jgi:hypothetical protein